MYGDAPAETIEKIRIIMMTKIDGGTADGWVEQKGWGTGSCSSLSRPSYVGVGITAVPACPSQAACHLMASAMARFSPREPARLLAHLASAKVCAGRRGGQGARKWHRAESGCHGGGTELL